MKMIELGGGDNPHTDSQCNVDYRKSEKVNFTIDFDKDPAPWPIQSDEWEVVYSRFCIEHVSWRNVPRFVGECFRILRPGGKVIIIAPNTEAQMQFILSKPEFDGDEGSMLFGDQNYVGNFHAAAFSPRSITKLFQTAGFENIVIKPYGIEGKTPTDMILEAIKPIQVPADDLIVVGKIEAATPEYPVYTGPNTATITSEQRAKLFDRRYFNGKAYSPYCWDFPWHFVTARNVLARKPESVLELGCGRGYVLKRLEDAGIPCRGADISTHANMTTVASTNRIVDLCLDGQWVVDDAHFDLCVSMSLLENIPEELLPHLVAEMQRTCKRGLHGINFEASAGDDTRATVRPWKWWRERLPAEHEILSTAQLERNMPIPSDYVNGDGKVKLHVGSSLTMFHHGWTNIDVIDAEQFAKTYNYNFVRHDVRLGLPEYKTGSVDLIFSAHFLEHLAYREGLAFLRECRRVLKPDGAMRIVVPDALALMTAYKSEGGFNLSQYDEINEGCANAKEPAAKLWSLLHEGHQACYDQEMLMSVLDDSGFVPLPSSFRMAANAQIKRETQEMSYGLSLFMDATPRTA